jgi:hypothetical protein
MGLDNDTRGWILSCASGIGTHFQHFFWDNLFDLRFEMDAGTFP